MLVREKNISGWLFCRTRKNKVLQSEFLPSKKIFALKNIVRIYHYKRSEEFRKRFNIAENTKILLFTGRVIREKRVYEIVNAFSLLREKHNIILIIVGDGSDFAAIKEIIKDRGLLDAVILTGLSLSSRL